MDSIYGKDSLIFYPEHGYGFYPVKIDGQYNAEYFDKYNGYAQTETGEKITKARIDLVARHFSSDLVDVGIGCGQFVQNRPMTYGYDINPKAIEWLASVDKWRDPYDGQINAACFWDSLEHIEKPWKILSHVDEFVFVSIPIFENAEHILRSKHFRKDEHYWYFTHEGFVKFMAFCGFSMLEYNIMETELGREGIGSYAFQRVRS